MKYGLISLIILCWFSSAGAVSLAPPAPAIKASSYFLVDYHSGYVIAENQADIQAEPASLTKMMTVYVVFQEIRAGNIGLEDEVLVSEKAWRMKGSRMFIEVNSRVKVIDLLKGVIIQSGNDASVALAEYVAGSEESFVGLMNQHAKRLEMTKTYFLNSTGLPRPKHLTTARDMATMAIALIKDFPEYYRWHAEKKFKYNEIVQYNRNKLLWKSEYIDGIKTGHTESAGYCLVSSALRKGMRLIAVVMGAVSEKSRFTASLKLINYGFRFYETHLLYTANKSLIKTKLWKGESDNISLGIKNDLYVSIPRGKFKKLKATTAVHDTIMAPVKRGEHLGTLKVNLGDTTLVKRPLVALESLPEGNLWRRTVDFLWLMAK